MRSTGSMSAMVSWRKMASCGDRPGMAPRNVYSGFSTVFLSLLLLAVGVGFPAACFWR